MAAAADSSGSSCAAVRLPRSPPIKVLAEQLRRDAEGAPGAWRLSRAAAGRGPLELAAVWMQGTVVAAGGGEARLRDPSGAFSVCGLERVPRGRPCLVPGNSRPLPAHGGGLGPGRGRGLPVTSGCSWTGDPDPADDGLVFSPIKETGSRDSVVLIPGLLYLSQAPSPRFSFLPIMFWKILS